MARYEPISKEQYITIVLKHIHGNEIPFVQDVEIRGGKFGGFAEVTITALITAESIRYILADINQSLEDAPDTQPD